MSWPQNSRAKKLERNQIQIIQHLWQTTRNKANLQRNIMRIYNQTTSIFLNHKINKIVQSTLPTINLTLLSLKWEGQGKNQLLMNKKLICFTWAKQAKWSQISFFQHKTVMQVLCFKITATLTSNLNNPIKDTIHMMDAYETKRRESTQE